MIIYYFSCYVPIGNRIIKLMFLNAMVMAIPIDICGFGLLKKYFVFFSLGLIAPEFIASIKKYRKIGILITILACLSYAFLFPFWSRTGISEFGKGILYIFNIQEVRIVNLFFDITRIYVVPFVASFSILMILYLSWFDNENEHIKRLGELGQRTIEIYALQYFFMVKFVHSSQYILINTVLVFVIGIVAPLFIGWLIRKNKLLALILLGRRLR